MREYQSRTIRALIKKRSLPVLSAVNDHMAGLSAGDKFIAGALGFLVVAFSLAGTYTLTRTFLVEVPSYGGTLTEGVLGSPRFVNPLLALSDADRDLATLVYAGLMGVGQDGALEPVLAESYEVSEDGETYTFVLRENIRFHDGSPVTADDVVFTVERAQDPGLKSPELANWSNIRAQAVDARTVQFTLPKAYAPFLEDATLGILPAKLWRNITNEEFPFSPLMTEPVGAGPFKVTSVERSRNGIIEQYALKAFDRYALGRPYLDSIRFEFFAQETDLYEAYERGRIESGYGIIADGALRVPYARVFGVFFNLSQNPLFARSEVREALSIALDRTKIVDEALGGYGTPVDGPVPPGSGIDVNVAPIPSEERLANARAALENEGWSFDEAEGVWEHGKEGLSLTLTLKTSNVPELKAVASAVQVEWQAFGVPTTLEFYEPGDLTSSVIRPRRFDALLFGMVVGRDHDLYAFWESSQRNDPGLNVAMYANRSVDELLEETRSQSNRSLATEDLAKLDELISADYPAAFLYAPDFLYALPKGLRGVAISQIGSPSDRFANAAKWYRTTEAVWPFLTSE